MRNGVAIAQIAEESGIAALTVHGRTRECRFKGQAEYDTIRQIKTAVSIPVIANGDIDSGAKARAVLDYTGADGVMIGRAARGRPWIFAEVLASVEHEPSQERLSITSVRDIILEHLDSLYSFYGEFTGVRVSRKHLAWYSQHQAGGPLFRKRVMVVETAREQLRLTQEFFDSRAHEAGAERERSRGERCGENYKHKATIQEEKKEKVAGGDSIGRYRGPLPGRAH